MSYGNLKCPGVCATGVSKEKREKADRKIFETLIAGNFSTLIQTMNLRTQEA